MQKELLKLTKERLVDALLELAGDSDLASDLVERLISTPKQNLTRFEEKLADLKAQNHFYDWRRASDFAHELRHMLDDLRVAMPDPKEGARQVVSFYEADETIFNSVDDSGGGIGTIFQYDAVELFCDFAIRCSDKEWLMELILQLNQNDSYGVRDSLVQVADKFLPETLLREMGDRLWKSSETENDEYKRRHWLHLVEVLATQLKDPHMFEKARLKSWGKAGPAACLDIAKIYFDTGDAKTALSWIERVPKDESFQARERDELLLRIYKHLGDRENQEEIAWRTFRQHRSESTLKTLLGVIGSQRQDQVIKEAVSEILKEKILHHSNADFLISTGRVDEAETYLMERKDQLNGDRYPSLLDFAAAMESCQKFYAASVIYRELANSILARAKSKYYHHGIKYIRKLGKLAPKVSNWNDVPSHDEYLAEIRKHHSRKRAFWSVYNEIKP